MPDLFDNPMGLMGFEFVEFASPTPGVIEPVLRRLADRLPTLDLTPMLNSLEQITRHLEALPGAPFGQGIADPHSWLTPPTSG